MGEGDSRSLFVVEGPTVPLPVKFHVLILRLSMERENKGMPESA
jgi:hypothetical protein